MTDSIPDLIAEARAFDTEPAPYAERLKGAHDLIARLADALESLSAPPASDNEREALIALNLVAQPKVQDGERITRIRGNVEAADIVLAAGYRRLSPLTREALIDVIMQHPWLANPRPNSWPEGFCPTCKEVIAAGHNSPSHAEHLAHAILSSLSVPEPAEVEYQCKMPGLGWGDCDAEDCTNPRRARRVTAWVPVEKGAEQL